MQVRINTEFFVLCDLLISEIFVQRKCLLFRVDSSCESARLSRTYKKLDNADYEQVQLHDKQALARRDRGAELTHFINYPLQKLYHKWDSFRVAPQLRILVVDFYRGDPASVQEQFVWGLCETDWHRGRISSEYFDFPGTYRPCHCSIVICHHSRQQGPIQQIDLRQRYEGTASSHSRVSGMTLLPQLKCKLYWHCYIQDHILFRSTNSVNGYNHVEKWPFVRIALTFEFSSRIHVIYNGGHAVGYHRILILLNPLAYFGGRRRPPILVSLR